MTIKSMTGFGRAEGARDTWQWHWEIKTVNARGLDVRLRLPAGLEALEPELRKALQAKLKRGACQVAFSLERQKAGADIRINTELAKRLMTELGAMARELGAAPPTFDAVMNVRGVIETAEPDADDDEAVARQRDIAATFNAALESLAGSRADEGVKLESVLESVLLEIETLVTRADDLAAAAPQNLQQKLEAQVSELLADRADMPSERIIQEVALLAGKAEIREELDRLRAHIKQAHELLGAGDAVGRKLDFLSQEFNREANTLCSKSSDSALTRVGLDLKAAIEQLREQVQNVE